MNRRKFIKNAAFFGAGIFLPGSILSACKPTPTSTPAPTATTAPTNTPAPTATPAPTNTSAPTATATVLPTSTATAEPTATMAHAMSSPHTNLLTTYSMPTLDPTLIEKYVDDLVIPPVMPSSGTVNGADGKAVDLYEISMVQLDQPQQILPAPLPKTTVWSYMAVGHPETQNYPAFTIEAQVDRPAQVKWINGLVDASGKAIPHLLPVEQALHWANPAGPRDMHLIEITETPGSYTGPVPIVTHVHGAHTGEESDGYPEAWYLPIANDIPATYFTFGSFYEQFKAQAKTAFGADWEPGSATFQYPNQQRATTLWYHDHTLGITRLNVYAGPAGFYLLRGGPSDLEKGLPGPAPKAGDGPGLKYYEIPVVIQDRAFNEDGSFFYPDSRLYFDQDKDFNDYGDGGVPVVPSSDILPIWNPEFFGNVMVTNGKSWPRLKVERRRYRLRLLNGCNSRFLILKIASSPDADRNGEGVLDFWQIGADGGFLQAPVKLNQLLLGPAERADVILDFTNMQESELYLINAGPDEPFGGGEIGEDFDPANIDTTGQVIKFILSDVDAQHPDTSLPPEKLVLPKITPLGPVNNIHRVSLNEMMSMQVLSKKDNESFGPIEADLGTVNEISPGVFEGTPLGWDESMTEVVKVGDVEEWEIYNFTADAHPIHVHLVMFEIVNRESLETKAVRGPEPNEIGRKDTVIAYPGEITRIRAHFDKAGRYVWHCHILEHEDNEMMRPYKIA